MECPNCHTNVADGSKFCTSCGTPLGATLHPEKPHCTSCGAELIDGAKFCTSCGAPIVNPVTGLAQPPKRKNPYAPEAQNVATQSTTTTSSAQSPYVTLSQPVNPVTSPAPPVMPPVTPPHEPDNQPEKKTNWTVIILIVVVIALIVALILVLTGKKSSSEYDWPDDSTAVAEEWVVAEPVDSVVAVVEDSYIPSSSSCTVYGKWDELSVRMVINYNTTSGNNVSASGYAYYGDSELCYRVTGNGTIEDGRLSLTLYEYDNNDNNYSGYWSGTLTYSYGTWNYYGYFYDVDGSQHCWFDLYSKN